jgi:hypothetical protein
MGRIVKVATRVLPPIIVELAQSSKEKYSGIELNIMRSVLGNFHFSVEHKFLVSTNKSQFEMEAD